MYTTVWPGCAASRAASDQGRTAYDDEAVVIHAERQPRVDPSDPQRRAGQDDRGQRDPQRDPITDRADPLGRRGGHGATVAGRHRGIRTGFP